MAGHKEVVDITLTQMWFSWWLWFQHDHFEQWTLGEIGPYKLVCNQKALKSYRCAKEGLNYATLKGNSSVVLNLAWPFSHLSSFFNISSQRRKSIHWKLLLPKYLSFPIRCSSLDKKTTWDYPAFFVHQNDTAASNQKFCWQFSERVLTKLQSSTTFDSDRGKIYSILW